MTEAQHAGWKAEAVARIADQERDHAGFRADIDQLCVWVIVLLGLLYRNGALAAEGRQRY